MFANLYRFRKRIWRVAWADFRLRYAGSGLGALWHLLLPIAQIVIYSAVFSGLMDIRASSLGGAGQSFVLYLCSGLFPWFAFSATLIGGSEALVRNAHYLTKLSVPEEVFVAQATLMESIGLAIYIGLLFAAGLVSGLSPSWTWFFVPLAGLLFQLAAFGLGLFLAVLRTLFPDLRHVLTIAMQLWLWLAPIVYLESAVPSHLRAQLHWNPVYWYVAAYRQLFLEGRLPSLEGWAAMLMWSTGLMLLGAVALGRLRGEIRDVL